MLPASSASIPSLLIVENESGKVFFVETNETESQVDRILKKKDLAQEIESGKGLETAAFGLSQRSRRISECTYEHTPMILSDEIKEELESSDDEDDYFTPYTTSSQVLLKVPDYQIEEIRIKLEPKIESDSPPRSPKAAESKTFNGEWSSDGDNDFDMDLSNRFDSSNSDSDEKPLAKRQATNNAKVTDMKSARKRKAKSSLLNQNGKNENEITTESSSIFPNSIRKRKKLTGKNACKYCETVFKDKKRLLDHTCEFLTSDKKNFICRICFKELSKGTFSNHHHEESDCPYCGKSYVNPRNMRRHIERAHKHEIQLHEIATAMSGEPGMPFVSKSREYPQKRGKFECDLCGKYLYSLKSMYYHLGMHTGVSDFICENCGEQFFTPKGLKSHNCRGKKKRRRPEKDFRTYDVRHCRYCDTRFANLDENKAHLCAYQDPLNKNIATCRFCKKVMNKSVFYRHMEIHTGIDWICDVCGRKLATERVLLLHKTTHTGNKPFKCKECHESFINKAVLDRHMRFHGKPVRSHRCEYCFKELSNEFSLSKHVQRRHMVTAICELCKLELPSREELKLHMERSHQPFPCMICNKAFILPRYLKMHEKIHFTETTNIDRVQCPFCQKDYNKKRLKAHIFRAHPEIFSSWHENQNL